ncbi:MAG: peptidoglycan DD-metalloendopeptidase family protein [Desulfobacterales bacterium]|nr:MAG: peptidoglycan DD-metalloendopeptidase family protein [Desulfobacterales bacterium]
MGVVLVGAGILGSVPPGNLRTCPFRALGAPPAHAADTETAIDEFQRQARDLGRQIKRGEKALDQYSQKEAEIVGRLDEIERDLRNSQRRIAALKAELDEVERKSSEAQAASHALRRQIQAREQYLAKRLVVLYKMIRLGKMHVLASAETVHDFIQRQAALERILAYDDNVRQKLRQEQLELDKWRMEMDAVKNEKVALQAEYQRRMTQMTQERSVRAKLLADIRQQKSLQLASVQALKESAQNLDRIIVSLSRSLASTPLEKKASSQPFTAHKGLLKMPVSGRIIHFYGPYKNTRFNVENFRSGIEIQAERGEPIRAVFGGKIIFSDWFKGYGNMIIIDHGEHYYTVYAHLEEVFKTKGEGVESGEVIATAGDTGSLVGPKLYFEVRHHGKPLDPMAWIRN